MTVIYSTIIEHIFEYDVILFPMSINNSLNRGFPYEIGLNCPTVKDSENNTNYGDPRKYGTIHTTEFNNTIFCACYIHNGGFRGRRNSVFVNYEYLEKCLSEVNKKFAGKRIATIVLGGNETDGNGDREKIKNMIKNNCSDCNITVYDFEEYDFHRLMFRKIAEVRRRAMEREIDSSEYTKIRSEIDWVRRNGIFVKKPEGYTYKPLRNSDKIEFRGSVLPKE